MRFDEVNMDNTIYGDVKFIIPTYVVETKKGEYHVSGTMCSIDTELGIICFYDNGSVQAMFRLEDVKAFWRII
jgi:hypothetical protein|nr:MAG TPA: hypothetical protein [Caudoviricetes sp.]